jgi:hypothetical protein
VDGVGTVAICFAIPFVFFFTVPYSVIGNGILPCDECQFFSSVDKHRFSVVSLLLHHTSIKSVQISVSKKKKKLHFPFCFIISRVVHHAYQPHLMGCQICKPSLEVSDDIFTELTANCMSSDD